MTQSPTDSQIAFIASLTRVRAGAGAIILNEEGHVLVVFPTYKDGGELPGGAVEQDESPLVACERELGEELGFVPPVGGLLCVDWSGPKLPWDGGLSFVFDGGVLPPSKIAEIRLPAEELSGFAFLPAEELDSVLIPRLSRRIRAGLDARGHGATYLEDGVPVPR